MNRTMTGEEVRLAQRIIGLRKGRFTATRNEWDCVRGVDMPARQALEAKGHIALGRTPKGLLRWQLTPQGIQQLKQQIGEFKFGS